MNRFLIIMSLAFIGWFGFSCMGTKNIPTKPDWLISRPVSISDYIGIGSAPVTPNVNEYQQLAKKNALNDLAGEISINISNTSFLHKLDVNDVLKETFDSRTQTSIHENLEGYTLIGTFEDKNTFWTYYRLSKSTYQSLKQQRIQKALDNALSKFSMALQYKNDLQYYNALIMLVKATEDIKPYLAEPLLTTYQNREIYFGNELFNEIFTCFNALNITSGLHEVSIKRGQMVNNESLTFVVSDLANHQVEGIPVVADFSGGGLINNKARTGKDGSVSFSIPKIGSKKNVEVFEAKIDVATLLQDATNDFIIKKLLRNFGNRTVTVETKILNPVFFIETTENSFFKTATNVLKEVCKETLVANACDFTENMAEADFILTIVTDIRKTEETGRFCKVSFRAEVNVKNKPGKTVYQRNISDITASQYDCERALNEAFSKGKTYLSTRVVPDILEELF